MNVARAIVTGIVLVAVAVRAEGVPVQWTSGPGANNHWYEFKQGVTTWTNANAAAGALTHLGSPGHLATVTSQEEHNFVVALFSGILGSQFLGPWIGGFQSPDQISPSAGFQWVTAETWSYTNFRTFSISGCANPEPNDGDCSGTPVENNDENHLHIYQPTSGSWLWNDAPDTYPDMPGYIVEFDPAAPVPEPTTLTLVGTGLLLGFRASRSRRRRP
jgi:hypothetical protein